jgi:hypothetical protein
MTHWITVSMSTILRNQDYDSEGIYFFMPVRGRQIRFWQTQSGTNAVFQKFMTVTKQKRITCVMLNGHTRHIERSFDLCNNHDAPTSNHHATVQKQVTPALNGAVLTKSRYC